MRALSRFPHTYLVLNGNVQGCYEKYYHVIVALTKGFFGEQP